MAKKVTQTEKKKGLKHCQKIITKADTKFDIRNREIKALRNEQLNMYAELKGMEEVLHKWEEDLST